MNNVKAPKQFIHLLRWSVPASTIVLLSACSYLTPRPPPKPAKLQKPAVIDTQQKDRARQALQRATASGNEYSACVMFSTSTHRSAKGSPTEIAAAASANCAPKLDDYEKDMTEYYEGSQIKSTTPSTARAYDRRVELEQSTRAAAVSSLEKPNQ